MSHGENPMIHCDKETQHLWLFISIVYMSLPAVAKQISKAFFLFFVSFKSVSNVLLIYQNVTLLK